MRRSSHRLSEAGMPGGRVLFSRPQPQAAAEREAVVVAYGAALAAHRPALQCYLAAIDALHRFDPDAARAVVARRAIRMLTESVNLVELAKRYRMSPGG